MPDLELRLRTALHAVEPEVAGDDDAWAALAAQLREPGVVAAPAVEGAAPDRTTTHPELVVDADGPDTAAPGRSRRRLALAVGLAAAIATGGLLATSPLRQSANGPATAPPAGIPRLVLDHPPAGIVVVEADDHNPGGPADSYVIGLRSTNGPRASVQIEAWPGTGASSDGDPVSVNDHPGTVQPGLREMTNLLWNDGTVTYQLLSSGPQMTDPAFALAVARSVTRTGTPGAGPPPFSLATVPDGFAVTYEGTGAALYPSGGYRVHYRTPDGLPEGAAPDLVLHVWSRALGADRLAGILGLDPVTVAGRPTYVGPVGFYAWAGPENPDSIMAIFEVDGAVVRADASFLSRPHFLDALAALHIVSDADWHRLVLDRAAAAGPVVVSESAGTVPATVPNEATPTTGSGPTTSLDPTFVEVPNVIGRRFAEASVALQAANLAQVAPTDCPSAYVPEGLVVSQEPMPGGRAATMTPVALCVARPLPHVP